MDKSSKPENSLFLFLQFSEDRWLFYQCLSQYSEASVCSSSPGENSSSERNEGWVSLFSCCLEKPHESPLTRSSLEARGMAGQAVVSPCLWLCLRFSDIWPKFLLLCRQIGILDTDCIPFLSSKILEPQGRQVGWEHLAGGTQTCPTPGILPFPGPV